MSVGNKIIGTISVGIIACLLSTSANGQLSRYEQWQQSRLFTIGAMYYDGPYGMAAQLPAPENAEPDMAMFRYAGLNLLDDVSHSNGGHQEYPGVSAAQEDGMPFMILGAGWAGTGGATPMDAFRNHVKFFADGD